MAAPIEVYGASEFDALGLHWASPFRELGADPTDPEQHQALVARAEGWIGQHLPWLLAAAKVYGLFLHCDGNAIRLVLPGEGTPPRMAMHLIGAIDPTAQPPLAGAEGQQLQ